MLRSSLSRVAGDKRPRNGDDTTRVRPPKKLRFVNGAETKRIRARPYLLGTACMPLDALTRTWSRGQNRPVNREQVRSLVTNFSRHGLNRQAEEN
jgi:hypothetical protein